MTISGENITLSGNVRGRQITYGAVSSGYGITVDANYNFTLKNITIVAGADVSEQYSIWAGAYRKINVEDSDINGYCGLSADYMFTLSLNASATVISSSIGTVSDSNDNIDLLSGSNVTFINSTLSSNINYIIEGNAFFTYGWYFNSQVNDSANNRLQNANVSAWDRNGNIWFSKLTDSNGNIPQQHLVEYMRNGTQVFYDYNNYTVNASKSGHINSSKSVNVTAPTFLGFGLLNDMPGVGVNSPANATSTANISMILNWSVLFSRETFWRNGIAGAGENFSRRNGFPSQACAALKHAIDAEPATRYKPFIQGFV